MFDFLTLYHKFSTEELLRIVQQPSLYQSAEVEAARSILSARNLSQEELDTVTEMIRKEEQKKSEPNAVELAQKNTEALLSRLEQTKSFHRRLYFKKPKLAQASASIKVV